MVTEKVDCWIADLNLDPEHTHTHTPVQMESWRRQESVAISLLSHTQWQDVPVLSSPEQCFRGHAGDD